MLLHQRIALVFTLCCCYAYDVAAQRVSCRVGASRDAMKDCSVNSGYVHIDSPLIAANIAIRSKFWFNGPDPEERSLSTISYFASGRKRQLSFQFQLQFKQDHVEAHDLEWGIFVEKPVRLPPRWMVAMLVAAARMIDPLLEADISERGIRWFSPLLPFMNVVNVIEAKSPLSPLDWNLGGDLPELAESNALLFSDRKSRSEGDRKKVCKTASASSNVETISQTRIYNFETFTPHLDLSTLRGGLGPLQFNLNKYLNGQPLAFQLKNKDQPLLFLEFTTTAD